MLPAATDEPWRLLTAAFAHLDLTHLGLNLLLLLLFGTPMERLWGRLVLTVCFFGASLGSYLIATVTSVATARRSTKSPTQPRKIQSRNQKRE